VLAATPSGGLVRTSGLGNGFDVMLGHTDRIGGLMLVDPAGALHNLNPSIIVAKPEPKPAPEPAPETKATQPDSSPAAEPAEPQ